MMIKSKLYKGIEYIQLAELPHEQQTLFNQSINTELIIKIQVNGKILHDCIQFKNYKIWYEGIFSAPVDNELSTPTLLKTSLKPVDLLAEK